ncbi:axoneme-associated protein mst101(2) isoform X2 [Drosophila takahashii]
MEVTLQSLLDTAKAEVKRKEAMIAQLRKEKDDLCFRRKRGREVEEPGEREHESKRLKESQPRMFAKKDPETERNPFKTVPKEDTKKATSKDDVKKASTKEEVKKTDSRSKSPKLGQPKTTERRSSTHSRRPEHRHKSRDRRHSRSRSPKHRSRRDEHRSRESNSRQARPRSRSQSPRIHLPGDKSQTMTSLFGDESNDPRSESPRLELAKTASDLQPSKKVVSKQSDVSSYTKSSFDPKEQPKDTSQPIGGFFSEVSKPKLAFIPGLDIISKAESLDFVPDQTEVVEKAKKLVEKSDFHMKDSAQDELKNEPIPLEAEMPQAEVKTKKTSSKHSTKEVRAVPKHAIIPGLDIISKAESLDFVPDQTEFVEKAKKVVENSNFYTKDSTYDELKKAPIPLDSKIPQVEGKTKKISSKHSRKEERAVPESLDFVPDQTEVVEKAKKLVEKSDFHMKDSAHDEIKKASIPLELEMPQMEEKTKKISTKHSTKEVRAVPKHAILPGLDTISKAESLDFVPDQTKVVTKAKKLVEKSDFHMKDSAHDELKKASNPLDPEMPQVEGKTKKILSKHSTKEVRASISELEGGKITEESKINLEKMTSLAIEAIDVMTAKIEERIDQELLPTAATVPTETGSQCNANAKACSEKDIQKPTDEPSRLSKSVAGIRIIEDIRLPKMADIDHIAVKVDSQCKAPTAITNSASNDQLVDKMPRPDELKDTKSTSYANNTPIKSANVLYAKPDSTKLDHNDENDEVILEAAMDLLTSEQDPTSIVDPSYPNLSIEEDAIEMALGELHQQSPDETVVTSTSNRAQQTPKQSLITILTQSPVQQSPLKSKTKSKKLSPMATPEKAATEKTPLKKRKVNMDSPTQAMPVPRLDLSIEDTSGTSLGGSDTSTVTKRCSLGHTDYQYEQIKDEVILRVKRRCRRRRPAPVEMQDNQAI